MRHPMPSRFRSPRNPRPRIYERDVRSPFEVLPKSENGPTKSRSYEYERLANVVIRNGFYNTSGGVGPDFSVRPTPTSAALMRSLGLLFRAEPAGFSVLFDRRREAALLSYLRRQVEDRGEPGIWTRLSFLMVTTKPDFVSFTDIPIDTNPSEFNFYFSNREAHREGEEVLLMPGERVTAAELLPVVSTVVPVPVTEDVETIEVVAVSGEVVLTAPTLGRTRIYLDFSVLPEDEYRIRLVTAGGAGRERRVLYTSFDPMPLAFADFFFTDPTPAGPGVFPVRRLFEPQRAEIVPTSYELYFAERSVRWIYFIVPGPVAYDNLEIRDVSNPAIIFLGPEPVVLPTGAAASRFVSAEPIPLFAVSPYRFELWGERDQEPEPRRLVRRLPVAGPELVRATVPSTAEIYVYL